MTQSPLSPFNNNNNSSGIIVVVVLLLLLVVFATVPLPVMGQQLQQWNSSSWSNGEEREISFGQRDPFDSSVELTGIGDAIIDGEGILTLEGDAPRFRIVDHDFENVNITFYAKRISEDRELSYQGFVVAARSKHYTNDECFANTYYARLTYDGRVSFEKELFHGHGSTAHYPPLNEPKAVYGESEVPEDEWIGLRFRVTTVDDGGSVLLQLFLDQDDTGAWQKVLEYKDTGNWPVRADDGLCGDYPHNKILFSPGFVFLRNDGLGEAQYRDFSIKELGGGGG